MLTTGHVKSTTRVSVVTQPLNFLVFNWVLLKNFELSVSLFWRQFWHKNRGRMMGFKYYSGQGEWQWFLCQVFSRATYAFWKIWKGDYHYLDFSNILLLTITLSDCEVPLSPAGSNFTVNISNFINTKEKNLIVWAFFAFDRGGIG